MVTNGGQSVPFGTPGGGAYTQDYIINPDYAISGSGYGPTLDGQSPTSNNTVAPTQYAAWAVVFILFVIGYKFATESKLADMDVADVKVGFHNLLVITFLSIAGIGVSKVLVNKYSAIPTPVKNLVNMV